MVLTSKLIDGTFPDYGRVIPQNNDKELIVDKKDFEAAVDRVSTISSERGRAVKLALSPGKLVLSVTNPDSGSATEELEVEYASDALDIGFNSRYLLDIAAQIEGEVAVLQARRSRLADAGAGQGQQGRALRADADAGVRASATRALTFPLPLWERVAPDKNAVVITERRVASTIVCASEEIERSTCCINPSAEDTQSLPPLPTLRQRQLLMTPSRIHRLSLTHFRNYRAASVQARGDVVVLVGPNGAGKTNCLEAISFLSPGRGLRRATLEDVADNQGDGSWAVSAEVEGALGLATLGTGIDAPGAEAASTSRRCRIDREPVSSATAFGDHLRMVWLTPAMDGLFMGAASERRRFFDRLVLAIDSEHSSRVSALERSLRSRNRLLEVRNYDDHWCDAIERETAELAVAVAATRGQTVTRLAAMLRERGTASAFPSAQIMLDGWMENALVNEAATAVEDRYREILRAGRARDAAAGRTLDGPHLTDLEVVYAPKNMPARDASTGEQKALLIGLVLAHATLVAEMTGIVPLLLLDEVVAHLDPTGARRCSMSWQSSARRSG